jgi:hypothetical protein
LTRREKSRVEPIAEALSRCLRVIADDIDPVAIANGIVAIMLSLLMSVVQLDAETAGPYSADVAAVFEAALDRTPLPRA